MSARPSSARLAVLNRLDGGEALHWCLDGWFQFGTAAHDSVAKTDLPNGRTVDALVRNGTLVLREEERHGDLIPVRRVSA